MEMRKYSDRRAIRLVVALYWLISGYALRPLRSGMTLLAILLAAAILMTPGVVSADGGYGRQARAPSGVAGSLGYLSEVTVTLSNRGMALSPLGRGIRLFVRIAGPALLALTVLSIRGRVKR